MNAFSFKSLLFMTAACMAFIPAAHAAISTDQFLYKAGVANTFEVETSKYIDHQEGITDEVKEFAGMMEDDHTAAQQDLRGIAGKIGKASAVPATLDAAHTAKLNDLKRTPDHAKQIKYLELQSEGHQATINMFEEYSNNGENASVRQFASEMLPKLRLHRDKMAAMPLTPDEHGM